VRAIAALAKEEPSDVVAQAYGGVERTFGPDFLIPSPFDQRLILRIAPAVAKAAMDSGVATRPIADFDAYMDRLTRFVFRSGLIMKPLVTAAKQDVKRVIYADGEDERVLRAAQVAIEDGLAEPILIGRPSVIESRLKRFGLKIRPDTDFAIINPEDDPRYRDYVDLFLDRVGRRGVTPEAARTMVRTSSTAIAALAVERGDADAMLCGLEGQFRSHFKIIREVIGLRPDSRRFAAMSLLISSESTIFLTDTYVNVDPAAAEIAELTRLAADQVRRFGIVPKVALLSHSNFGSHDTASSRKMRQAVEILWQNAPELEVDGEMHGDAALSEAMRQRAMPTSKLTGEANLLVFPNIDAANITLNVVKTMTDALHVGPILLGAAKPAHILTPSVTSRGVANMTTLAAVEAQAP
jgi:malate dehydrogenase (oxaloacetate-decarboxylating)(NADP+)